MLLEITKEKHVNSFSRHNPAVAEAKPGDMVLFHTFDCYGETVTREDISMADQFPEGRPNNPATGPLYIEGAEAGDVLAVEILDIEVAETGVVNNDTNNYPLATPTPRIRILEVKHNTVEFNGIKWQVEPMIGVIGLAMDDDEELPTMNVFPGGGNMDNRLITKGTTVYLPVRVDGGLLAIGDLHATMGDGEVCGNGLEISGKVLVRLHLIKDFDLHWPVLETADRWYVNTQATTTDEAIRAGYIEMQRLLAKAYDWDLTDASIYMTLHGYLEASQACLSPHGGGNSMRIGTQKIPGKPLIPQS